MNVEHRYDLLDLPSIVSRVIIGHGERPDIGITVLYPEGDDLHKLFQIAFAVNGAGPDLARRLRDQDEGYGIVIVGITGAVHMLDCYRKALEIDPNIGPLATRTVIT